MNLYLRQCSREIHELQPLAALDKNIRRLLRPAVAHGIFGLVAKSVRLVADEGDNHAVEVEEEHQEVEAKLDEGFLERKSSQSVSLCGLMT